MVSWQANLDAYRIDPDAFFAGITEYLQAVKPRLFRWHSAAGDIPDKCYLEGMIQVAKDYPDTRFLVFTKRWLDSWIPARKGTPANLQVILSAWPGMSAPPRNLGWSTAWLDDGTEDRIPEDGIPCEGYCGDCGLCWGLARTGRDLILPKH